MEVREINENPWGKNELEKLPPKSSVSAILLCVVRPLEVGWRRRGRQQGQPTLAEVTQRFRHAMCISLVLHLLAAQSIFWHVLLLLMVHCQPLAVVCQITNQCSSSRFHPGKYWSGLFDSDEKGDDAQQKWRMGRRDLTEPSSWLSPASSSSPPLQLHPS